MNKIYKLVWSKVRNTWVVASEIAKGHGKESSSGRNGKRLKLAVMTAILGGCFMTAGISPVAAALSPDQQAVYDAVMEKLNKDGVKKIHYLSIGPDNEKNLAQDGNYNNDGVEQHWGIAIGVNASSKDGDGIAMGKDSRSRGNQSIGLGSLSSAVGTYSTAVGHRSQAFGYSASAYGALARAYGANGVALGAGALVANSKALTKAEYDALPEEEKALYHTEIKQSDYYQYKQKTDSGKIEDIEVNGVAIGNYASSIGFGGVAIGDRAKASDEDNIENSKWGVAIGASSQNKVEQGVAIGILSVADRAKNVKGYLPTTGKAIENFEEAMEATGKGAAFKDLGTKYTTAKNELKKAQDAYNADNNPTNKMNLEKAKETFKGLTNEFGVMTGAWVSRRGAVSIGNDKTGFTRQLTGLAAGSEDTDAVNVAQLKALNTKVDQGADNITELQKGWTLGVARGDDSANDSEATAEGANAKVSAGDKVTLKAGRGIKLKQDGTNVQIGLKFIDMDPAGHPFNDAKAIGGGSLAVGQNSVAEEHQATAVGLDTKSKQYGVALGAASEAGKSAVAIGNRALASGEGSIAIGTPKQKVEGYPDKGFRKVDSNDAIAIGTETAVDGASRNATVVGPYADIANSNYSTALGNLSKVENAALGTALGNNAAVIGAQGGVAIGAHSVANRNGFMPGYNPAGEQWSDFWDYLEKTGQKDAYNQAAAEFGAAQQALQADEDNPELKTKFNEAKAKWNKIFGTWAGSQGAVSIGDEKAGFTRQLTGLAAGTNDTDAVNVAQLKALNTKVDKGAVHYYSVTSDKKAAGSNFDNDGAKAADSMVIGIGSSSEAQNSTVLGNNNTLKRYNADRTGSSSRNNIVAGQNLEVEGAYNAVFGTDYQNNRENRKTMVAGKYNTVIGLGNLAGYTAEKDPQDRFKWIYNKVQGGSDSGNVVVGMNNTATRGSNVIGTDSEASSLGTSVGSDNKIIGDGDYGLALGSHLTVNGEKSVAIGSESKATADYATAIGKGAVAAKEDSIAFGRSAKAENNYSVAVGAFTSAKTISGVALGSSSAADTEKGVKGYLAGTDDESEVWKSTKGAVSIGNAAKKYTRQITNLAAGTKDTDAVNVAQLKVVNDKADKNAADITDLTTKVEGNTSSITKINNDITNLKAGSGVHYFSVASNPDDETNPDGTNWKNDGAKDVGAIAIGRKASVKGIWSIASGYKANVVGEKSIAMGVESSAKGNEALAVGAFAKAEGLHATAIGAQSNANGMASIAFGQYSKADGVGATAFGFRSNVKSEGGLALGPNTQVTAKFGTAIGLGAIAKQEEGVALGTQSFADRAPQMPGYTPVGEQWSNFEDYLTKTGQKDAYDQAGAELKAAKQALSTVDPNHRDTPEALEIVAKYQQAGTKLNKIFSTWAGAKGAVSIGNEQYNVTRQLTGLAAGTKDTDAVNVAQLKALAMAPMNFYFGGKVENNVYTAPDKAANTWSMPLNEFRMDFGDGLKAEQVTDKDGKKYTRVTLDKKSLKGDPDFKGDTGAAGAAGKDGKSAYDTWKGLDGNDGKSEQDFINSLKGKDGTNGTNGEDGKSAYDIWKEKPGNENKTTDDFIADMKGPKGDKGDKGDKGQDGTGGAGGTDFTVTADGPKADSEFKVDADHAQLKIAGDKTNITTSIEKDNTVKVALNQDIKVNSVEVGAKDGKPGVKIGGDGINMNGKKITNVADGKVSADSKDAVNGSQLFETKQQVFNNMNQINSLRDESREGDALGAAMAALKPLDFDPYQRSQVMAGVGYYRGKEAVALGLAHYKNEDLMFHGGLAYAGNSELMANIGVTYRFGSKDDRDIKHDRNLRMPQYAEGPISSVYILQDEVDRLTKENKEANDRIAALEAKLEKVLEKVK